MCILWSVDPMVIWTLDCLCLCQAWLSFICRGNLAVCTCKMNEMEALLVDGGDV